MRRLNPRQAREVVTVRTRLGSNSSGPVYAAGAPTSVRAAYLEKRQLVRDASGAEVVSEVTLLASPELNPAVDLEALLVPGAEVTVRGTAREVIGAAPAINRTRVVYVSVTLT